MKILTWDEIEKIYGVPKEEYAELFEPNACLCTESMRDYFPRDEAGYTVEETLHFLKHWKQLVPDGIINDINPEDDFYSDDYYGVSVTLRNNEEQKILLSIQEHITITRPDYKPKKRPKNLRGYEIEIEFEGVASELIKAESKEEAIKEMIEKLQISLDKLGKYKITAKMAMVC